MGQQSSAPQGGNNEEATWWCRLLARGIGVIGALGKSNDQNNLPESMYSPQLFVKILTHLSDGGII